MVFLHSNLDCTLLHAKVLAINYVTLYHFSLLITDNLVIIHPLYILLLKDLHPIVHAIK